MVFCSEKTLKNHVRPLYNVLIPTACTDNAIQIYWCRRVALLFTFIRIKTRRRWIFLGFCTRSVLSIKINPFAFVLWSNGLGPSVTRWRFVYLTFPADILPTNFPTLPHCFVFLSMAMTLSKLFDKMRYELFRFFTSSSRSTTTPLSVDQTFVWYEKCPLPRQRFSGFRSVETPRFEKPTAAKEKHHNGWRKDLRSIICACTYRVHTTNGNRFSWHPHDYHRLMGADVSVNQYSPGGPGPSVRPHVYFSWNSIYLRWENLTKISIFRRPEVASCWRSRTKIVSNC